MELSSVSAYWNQRAAFEGDWMARWRDISGQHHDAVQTTRTCPASGDHLGGQPLAGDTDLGPSKRECYLAE